MLKLQFRDRRREAVWLVDQVFTIGKNPANSLMIDDQNIKDFHAEIINDKDQLVLVDKSNNKSILVNGKQVSGRTPLKAGDIIMVADVELELVDPKSSASAQHAQQKVSTAEGWSIQSKASWLEKSQYSITSKVVIGRDPSCDITLPLEHLSRRHVELEVKGGQLYIKDLDSSNGTFLNGKKITTSIVQPGDKIKLDVVTFEVSGPNYDPNKTIIRTLAPEKAEPNQAPTKPTQTTPPSNLSTPQKANTASAKTSPEKRLSAAGKQDWIAQERQVPPPKKSRVGLLLLAVSALVVLILAAVIFLGSVSE